MILAFYSEASGTGKDAAAGFAIDWLRSLGFAAVRDAFADDGKVVCADALGITGTRDEKVAAIDRIKLRGEVKWDDGPSDLDDTTSDIITGREFIIGLLGSPGKGNGVRGLAPKFWTRQVIERAGWASGWTVISDLRFQEEAESVISAGGKVVEIVRGENLGKFNEQRLPPELIDRTIDNNGSLEDLRAIVEDYVNSLVKAAVRS